LNTYRFKSTISKNEIKWRWNFVEDDAVSSDLEEEYWFWGGIVGEKRTSIFELNLSLKYHTPITNQAPILLDKQLSISYIC